MLRCFLCAETESGVSLHFVMCESQTFGRGFFDVLEGEECEFEVYLCVYDSDSESERSWALGAG